MAPQVLILSMDPARAKRFAREVHSLRLRAHVLSSISMVSPENMVPGSLVVLDADYFDAEAEAVFGAVQPLGLPVLVVMSRFDTPQWISLMKRGASEVIRDPVSQQDFRESVLSITGQLQWKREPWEGGWIARTLRAGRAMLGI